MHRKFLGLLISVSVFFQILLQLLIFKVLYRDNIQSNVIYIYMYIYICLKHVFDCFGKNTKMLYVRNTNAFIAVKVFIILSNQGGARYGPNFFASASSG